MNSVHILSDEFRGMASEAIAMVPKVAMATLVAIFFLVGGKRFSLMLTNRLKRKSGRSSTNLILLFERTFRIGFLALGLFISFSIVIPSLRFADLMLVWLISVVALGLAFRQILQNFFAGILILMTRTFEVGDRIGTGSSGGTVAEGTVEEITLRTTVIRSESGERVIIPNALLMNREITHRYYAEKGKVSVLFYVPVDAHLEAVIRLAKEVFREMGTAVDAPRTRVSFEMMTERAIGIRATWHTNQIPPSPRASKEYFMTRLQEELHRYGAHLGLLEEFTVRSYDGGLERAISLSHPANTPGLKTSLPEETYAAADAPPA